MKVDDDKDNNGKDELTTLQQQVGNWYFDLI
jgi:hypothetical protein